MPEPRYAAHENLVVLARPYRALWRLVLGLLVVAGVVFGLNSAMYAILRAVAPSSWMAAFIAPDTQGATPLSMLILLGSFVFLILAVMFAARQLQKRRPLGLVGPIGLAVSQFWQVLRALLILGFVLVVLPPWGMGAPLEQNLAFVHWLLLLPVSLLAILIQTSAEEILFRGYIQQSLAARFTSPLIWMVLPSVLFAAGHYLPAVAGENAGLIALWSGVFGVLMADLTARSGTLGPAIAVHLFNNVIALLIVALPGALSGLSLYLAPFGMADAEPMRAWLAVDFALMLVSWLAARLALRR
jgi:membrane protease YdiL (CAAX protease family)